jgi:hypothetical protein
MIEPMLNLLRHHTTFEKTEALLKQVLKYGQPEEIIARLNDSQEPVALRASLITIIPHLKDKYNNNALIDILAMLAAHPESQIRYVVGDALAYFPGVRSKLLLQVLTQDPNSTIRDVAFDSLAEIELAKPLY